jgi:hypothetical protein
MFGTVERFMQKRAAIRFHRSPLGQDLRRHTTFYFEKSILRGLPQESKDRLTEDFYGRIIAIAQSDNPFMHCREQIADYAISYANFQVLSLKPEEQAEGSHDSPYISGQLHVHIRECSAHNDELSQLLWKHPEVSDQDLIERANAKCAVYLYFLNGLNRVRYEFKDYEPAEGKDWFRPVIRSMLISEEANYRRKIGLPSPRGPCAERARRRARRECRATQHARSAGPGAPQCHVPA